MSHAVLREALADVGVTTATPFTDGGAAVDHGALTRNVQTQADAGASVFIACGNTGEFYSLSDRERVAVVRTHAETLAGEDAVVVGGVAGCTDDARSLAVEYEDAGADAVMVMYPAHTYVHERGLVEYYRRIADATDLGLVVYKRGPKVPPRTIETLVGDDSVVAVKYAVDDVQGFSRLRRRTDGEVTWLNGIAERYALAFAIEGADGFTTGIGNFAPRAALALQAAIEAGDWEEARRLRDALTPFEELRSETGPDNSLGSANNVPAVKYGLELAGMEGGPVREPLVGLSEGTRERADRYYDQIASTTL